MCGRYLCTTPRRGGAHVQTGVIGVHESDVDGAVAPQQRRTPTVGFAERIVAPLKQQTLLRGAT